MFLILKVVNAELVLRTFGKRMEAVQFNLAIFGGGLTLELGLLPSLQTVAIYSVHGKSVGQPAILIGIFDGLEEISQPYPLNKPS